MTSGNTEDWPGRETDPAFSVPPRRDFDGGLLRRWSFQLTVDDALVWLRLTQPMTRGARQTTGLACFAMGAIVALLPQPLVGPWGSARFVLTLLALVGAVLALTYTARTLSLRRRARALIPVPRRASFEEWIDCIAVSEVDSDEDAYLSPELIGAVALTRDHIIVQSHSSTLLIPTRAFATRSEAQEMALHLRELAKGPYYFDAPD